MSVKLLISFLPGAADILQRNISLKKSWSNPRYHSDTKLDQLLMSCPEIYKQLYQEQMWMYIYKINNPPASYRGRPSVCMNLI